MAVVRLGDIIDDHCSRCHLIMDHSVVAMVGEGVKRVRCRTCNHEHDYRQGKAPQKKPTKAKLSPYEEVLASITAGRPGAPPAEPPQSGKSAHSTRDRSRSLPPRSRSLPRR